MSARTISLDQAPLGVAHAVHHLTYSKDIAGWPQRLEELGFLPGERVAVLKQGPTGEPLAVRVGQATFALRRIEAACVLVRPVAG